MTSIYISGEQSLCSLTPALTIFHNVLKHSRCCFFSSYDNIINPPSTSSTSVLLSRIPDSSEIRLTTRNPHHLFPRSHSAAPPKFTTQRRLFLSFQNPTYSFVSTQQQYEINICLLRHGVPSSPSLFTPVLSRNLSWQETLLHERISEIEK